MIKKQKKKWILNNGKVILVDEFYNEKILRDRIVELGLSIISEELINE